MAITIWTQLASGFVSRFWVRVHEIQILEIRVYKLFHLFILAKEPEDVYSA